MNTRKNIFEGLRVRALFLAIPILASAPVFATPLTGSGTLLLPATCPTAPGCGSTLPGIVPNVNPNTNAGFTATWSPTSGVAAPWVGAFSDAGGLYPSGAAGAGTTLWSFANVGSFVTGSLPTGTFVGLSDMDNGSGGNEQFKLIAYSDYALTQVITSAWLDAPSYVQGASAGDFIQASMPGFSFNNITGVYNFDGNSVGGNPSILVWMSTNQVIKGLSVQKYDTSYGLAVAAPTPEPSSFLMIGLGLVSLRFATLRAKHR